MQRALLALVLLILNSVAAFAQTCNLIESSFIQAPASLNPRQCIYSPNQEFILINQEDGNVVLYRSNNIRDGDAIWSTNTFRRPGARLVMQHDGNVVVYYEGGRVGYTARSEDSNGDYFLTVQDDGNVVAYRGIGPDTKYGPVWSSMQGVVRTKAYSCPSCKDGDGLCQLHRQSCNGCLALNAARVGASGQCVACVYGAIVSRGSIGDACAAACGSAASANEVASNKGC